MRYSRATSRSLILIATMAVVMVLLAPQANAQYVHDENITQALEEIVNAIDPGDAMPDTQGQLVVRWTNPAGGDTTYAGTTAISTSVDTGYDINDIAGENLDTGTATIGAGDSRVIAIGVENYGNNATAIDFDAYHLIEGSDISNDTFTMSLYWEDGFSGPGDFDEGTATEIGPDRSSVPFEYADQKTFFAVITAEPDASDGDEVNSEYFVTNNAPKITASGDGWERGEPIGEDDTYDTQYLTFTTTVAGPVLSITKSQDVVEDDARPGGQIDYTLEITNTGSDTATDVTVVDAVPQFATYVGGSAGGDGDPTIEHEDTYDGEDWTAGDDENAVKIRWTYDEVGYEAGINSRELNFSVTID